MTCSKKNISNFFINLFILVYYVLFQLVHFIFDGTYMSGIFLIFPIAIALVIFILTKKGKNIFK